MKTALVAGVVLALAAVGLGGRPAAQSAQGLPVGQVPGNGPPPPSWTPGAVTVTPDTFEVLPVQGQVHLVAGAGGNIVVQAGDDGLLVVDTGMQERSEQVLSLLQQHFKRPIRFVINTSADMDHVGGNATIATAGRTLAGRGRAGQLGGPPVGAQIYSHEKVLLRLSARSGEQSLLPFPFWPTDTFFTDEKQLFFNGEAVQLLYQPAAHTDGDVLVFFRRSDVVAAGDIFSTRSYPVFDAASGGSYRGTLTAMNRLLDIMIPDFNEEGGTYVIPGHGHIGDEHDAAEYRDMATIIHDRIEDLVKKGMTLEQVKAARPTLDYDGRYRATAGEWTTDRFIEAVYRELAQPTR
ncbi:MAG: MBL fold metallo-hydrolase [Acidobacteria bacterium]|nr:MBL fold metallo-hydrolase [Acidobacteriota bacterium]